MLSQFVFDLAGSLRALPLFHACSRRCVLLCLFAAPAFAQNFSYRVDHWTIENGLPQNTVTSVVQTRDGYLWMTTFDGLARFDGVRFTVFSLAPLFFVRCVRMMTAASGLASRSF